MHALTKLRDLYGQGARKLPDDVVEPGLGAVWRNAISGDDRERAFQAMEVAALFTLRRAVRNGSVWIEHSLSFRGRERLFLPAEQWKTEATRHYARLSLPTKPAKFLEPLLAMVRNTTQMQSVLDRWANRRQVIPPELIGKIAPTRLEGINLRGVFRFPVERYAGQILPSKNAAKTTAVR